MSIKQGVPEHHTPTSDDVPESRLNPRTLHAQAEHTTEQRRILAEFLATVSACGQDERNYYHFLPLFFSYINMYNIDFKRLRVPEAQDFQMYLIALSTPEGKRRFAKSTIARLISHASSFYEYLKERHEVMFNPFPEIIRLKQPKVLPRQIPSEEETGAFLAHLREFGKGKGLIEKRMRYRAHVVAEVLYATGARINEIMRAAPEDVDLQRNCIRITDGKSKRVRECFLNEYAAAVLRLYLEEMREVVIFTERGGDTTKLFGADKALGVSMSKVLHRESSVGAFPAFTCHKFRHAVATHLLRAGCDIRYIKEILGHRYISSTQIYTAVDKSDLQRVIDEYHPREHCDEA